MAKFCANCGSPFGVEGAQPVTTPAEVSPRPQGPAPTAPPPQLPYSSPPTYPPASVRYGGFWIRFVAAVIDWFVVSVVVWPVTAMIGLGVGFAGGAVAMPRIGVHLVNFIVATSLSVCANWLYEALMESSSRQATLGKMALALKVTDLEGRRISFARATG